MCSRTIRFLADHDSAEQLRFMSDRSGTATLRIDAPAEDQDLSMANALAAVGLTTGGAAGYDGEGIGIWQTEEGWQ